MSQRINKLKTWSAAILLGMTAAIPAQADDTEIYTGLNSAANGAVDPNVLFILDTSGSMGSSVTRVIAAYDPTTTYTGSCVNSRVYYSTSGTPPTCGTSRYFDLYQSSVAQLPIRPYSGQVRIRARASSRTVSLGTQREARSSPAPVGNRYLLLTVAQITWSVVQTKTYTARKTTTNLMALAVTTFETQLRATPATPQGDVIGTTQDSSTRSTAPIT